METTRKTAPFHIVAGVLMLLCTCFYCLDLYAIKPMALINPTVFFYLCISIGLFLSYCAAGKVILSIACVFNAVLLGYNSIADIWADPWIILLHAPTIFNMVACLFLALFAVFTLENNSNPFHQKAWFLPGLFRSVTLVLTVIMPVITIGNSTYSYIVTPFTVLTHILQLFAFFFAGLALRNSAKPTAKTPVNAPVQNAAAELKKFKDLLDTGVISQDEFDAMKKKLL